MQPPLNWHIPVTHAVSDLHAEVSVVAVDVLDGSEVIFLFAVGIRTGTTEWQKYKNLNSTHTWILNHPLLIFIIVLCWCTCSWQWVLLQVWTAPFQDSSPDLRWYSQPQLHTTLHRNASWTRRTLLPCRKTWWQRENERTRGKVHYPSLSYQTSAGILLWQLSLNNSWTAAVCDLLWLDKNHLITLITHRYAVLILIKALLSLIVSFHLILFLMNEKNSQQGN